MNVANDTIPAEFDWVKARGECSARDMFERLRSGAEQSVAARKKVIGWPPLDVVLSDGIQGSMFSVFSKSDEFDSMGVRFALRDGGIAITTVGDGSSPAMATVTFTRHCECKLKFGTEDLYPWQVLQMTLEHILFRR